MNTLAVVGGLTKAGGGTSYSVPGWSNALARQNVQRTLVTIKSKNEEICDFVDANLVNLKIIPGFKTSFLNLQWSFGVGKILLEFCRHEKIQLIHNHGVWLQVNHAAADVARQLKIPLVITPHGMLTLWDFYRKSWKKIPAWWFYQKRDLETAKVIHVTARNEAEELRQLGFKGTFAIIPNGLEMPTWREPVKKDNGFGTALFVSRIHPKKGLMNLVAAWAKVRPKGWKMRIVGPDEDGYLKVIQNAVRDMRLTQDFIFEKPVYGERLWNVYRESDLFILPTMSENFGNVVPEALACGVPVITTQGAPWEDLEDYSCGWWIPIGIEPLAKALSEAVEATVQERQEMGKRGRRLVEEKYTWSSVSNKMKMLYEWVLSGGPPPPFVRLKNE